MKYLKAFGIGYLLGIIGSFSILGGVCFIRWEWSADWEVIRVIIVCSFFLGLIGAILSSMEETEVNEDEPKKIEISGNLKLKK